MSIDHNAMWFITACRHRESGDLATETLGVTGNSRIRLATHGMGRDRCGHRWAVMPANDRDGAE